MTKHKIEDVTIYYENYKVKIKGKWYFITRDKFENAVKGMIIEGEIVPKRTRTWLE